MRVLELFAGTRTLSDAFERRGHETFTIDWDPKLERIDLHCDIGKLEANEVIARFGRPDVIWASPDCTTYSVSALGRHRIRNQETGELDPTSEYAAQCDATNAHLVKLIQDLAPRFFFIENPRGGLRTMGFMRGLKRYTVTYCQYGEDYQKPTDIWTNHPNPCFKPPCSAGDPCHVPSPRGSHTGLQAHRSKLRRAKLPDELCEHIVDICERIPTAEEAGRLFI